MKNSEEQKVQHLLKPNEETHKLKQFSSQISFLNDHSMITKEQEGDEIAQKMPQFLVMIQKIKFKFMARRLLNSTRSFMFKNILPQQLKQIDDKSYATESGKGKKRRRKKDWMHNSSYDPRQSNNQMSKTTSNDGYDGGKLGMSLKFLYRNQFLQQFLKMVDRKISVFDPTSVEKIVWDVINVVMIFVYTIQIPLFVTFNQQRQWQFHWFLIISVPFFLVIDTILAINTGCYDKGRLIKKRINLLDINFTRQIVPDFLISMSYALFIAVDYPLRGITDSGSITTRWRDILLLPLFWKLQEFGDIVEKLQGHSILSKKSRNIIGLIKLIITIVYIGHLLSCFWILIAELENSLGYSTWTKLKQFDSASWHQIYIDSFYFSTVTMITVGYGDFIPVNEAEKTICIVIMIFSCGVFAYSMNTVGAILESFNEDQVKKNLNMSIINAYMTRKNVSKLMKNQIREYLDYYWKEESERDQEAEEKIISQLSDQLKKGLLVESKNVVLKKSAIFRNNFSDAVKELIVPLIKEYRCSPQEMICVKGDPNDCSIYFIEKGSVEVIFESSDAKSNMVKSLACIQTGDSFGEGSFFTGKCRSASIRSREFTTLLILNRAEFLKILVNYPDDYEKFCTIRDSLCFYDDFKQIGVSCLSCNSKMHQIANCNYLHFNANTPHLREMFSQPRKQEREQWCRQRNNRSSARLNLGIVNKTAMDYQGQHEDSIEYLDYGQKEESSENDEDNSEQNEEELLDLAENNKHLIPKNQIINEEEIEEDSFSKREKNPKDKDNIDSPTSKGSLKYSSDKTQKHASPPDVSIFQPEHSSKNQPGFTEMHLQYDNSLSSKGQPGIKNQKILNRTDSLSPQSSSNQRMSKFIAYQSHSSNLGDSGESQRQKSGLNIGKTYSKILMVKALESNLKKKELIKRSNQKLGTVAGKFLSPYTNPLVPENPIPNKKSNLGFLRGAGRKQSVNSDRKTTFIGKLHSSNPPSNILGNAMNISEIRRASVDTRGIAGSLEFPVAESHDLQLEEQYDEERAKIDKANKVEDDFDVMQNFMFYFPLNNFNYQVQLLQIPKEERRRIMIWNSYDSNSSIVIKSSSFRTKRRDKKAPVLNLTVKKQSSNFLEKQPARTQEKALTLKLLDQANLKIKSNLSQKFSERSPYKQENIQKDGSFQISTQNKGRKHIESKTIVVPSAKPYRYSQRQSTVESGNQNNTQNGNNNQIMNIFIPVRTSSLLGGKPSAETSATITMLHNDLTDVKHISSVNCIPIDVNNNGQNENTKGNNNLQTVEIDKQESQILHQSNQSNNCIMFDYLIPSNSNIGEQKNQGDTRSRDVEYQFDDSLFSINELPIVFKDYRDSGVAAFQSDNGYNITVQDSEITQDLGANKPNIENVFFQSVTSKRK